jgi:hypothetical protein
MAFTRMINAATVFGRPSTTMIVWTRFDMCHLFISTNGCHEPPWFAVNEESSPARCFGERKIATDGSRPTPLSG